MRKIYRSKLSLEERSELEAVSRKRYVADHRALKARALLLCDESENGGALREIESKAEFAKQVRATVKRRNEHKAKTNWQLTNEDARIKLRSLYPSLEF